MQGAHHSLPQLHILIHVADGMTTTCSTIIKKCVQRPAQDCRMLHHEAQCGALLPKHPLSTMWNSANQTQLCSMWSSPTQTPLSTMWSSATQAPGSTLWISSTQAQYGALLPNLLKHNVEPSYPNTIKHNVEL